LEKLFLGVSGGILRGAKFPIKLSLIETQKYQRTVTISWEAN